MARARPAGDARAGAMGVPLPPCIANLTAVLIGFEPQRTGTSDMTLLAAGIAQTTGLVALANATRGGRDCCSTETHFLVGGAAAHVGRRGALLQLL